jgi:threonyl-tRNA synthetase
MAKDALGRKHQVATIQLDFVQPKRFELTCINETGAKEDVVMLHVAIMGSIERFLSVIIEHFAGHFPTWLAPVQVKIIPIGERQADFAYDVYKKMKDAGIRVEIDQSNDGLGKKVRNAKTEKIPYVLVIGDKEIESGMFALETKDAKKDATDLKTVIANLKEEIANRSL